MLHVIVVPSLPPGIFCLQIEFPSAASPVNVYLIEDSPLTIVDTGPNLPASLHQLEQGLAAHGYQIEDLERVVVTHPHIDHAGLASIVRNRSGAEVCAAAGSEAWLGSYRHSELWIRAWRQRLMLRHGVPARVVASNSHEAVYRTSWDPSVDVDRPLLDGDTLEFKHRQWRAASRPGHSPFDLLLDDQQHGYTLVGDHLISHISSNALITPMPDGASLGRPQALLQYRLSLAATVQMNARVLLAGHGQPILDHRALIERRLAGIDRRSEQISTIVGAGPTTAYEIARILWGERAEQEAWLTISEVLGHIDLLKSRGRVTESERPPAATKIVPCPPRLSMPSARTTSHGSERSLPRTGRPPSFCRHGQPPA